MLAEAYARTGCPNLAADVRERLLGADDQARIVYAALYSECKRIGEYDSALRTCRRAVEADAEDHAAYFAMAHTMATLKYSAAYIASVLENAIGIDPSNSVYRISAAIQLVSCSRLSAAYQHLRSAPVDRLRTLTCRCSIEKLVALSLWANDPERCGALSEALRSVGATTSKYDTGTGRG